MPLTRQVNVRPAQNTYLSWIDAELQKSSDGIGGVVDAVEKWLSDTIEAAKASVIQHSHAALFISLFLFLGPWILLIPLLILQSSFFLVMYTLGFCLSKFVGGSPTDLYRAFCHGGHTPQSSILTMLQSSGTHYNDATGSSRLLLLLRLFAAVLATYIMFGIFFAPRYRTSFFRIVFHASTS